MGGQPVSHLSALKSVAMTLLFPFRRSFDRPWGNVILRIGPRGNEEDFLDRDPPKQSDNLLADAKDFVVPDKSETFSNGLCQAGWRTIRLSEQTDARALGI